MAGIIEKVKALIAWALVRKPVRAYLLYSEQKGPLLAAAVTYRALFSIAAAVLLSFSIAAVWLAGQRELFDALVAAVNNVIPGLVGKGEGYLVDPGVLLDQPAQFTITGIISLVALLFAAIGAVAALRDAIRITAGTTHQAVSPILLIVRDLLFALILAALIVAAAVTTFMGTALVTTLLEWVGISESGIAVFITRAIAIVVTLVLDAALIAIMFWMLSGMKASLRVVLPGAVIGAVGLIVLQQLSGLFVGGATRNPLLGTFAVLIALLLWVNLSVQVVLIACAYIIVGVNEQHDHLRERFGAETFAQRKVRRAESAVQTAVRELQEAREAEEKERASSPPGAQDPRD